MPNSNRTPDQTTMPLERFPYGVAYYPEHWPETVCAGDPELFRNAGFNTVRMGEFAWDIMEPAPGEFDFDLFDITIERLAKAGINTIFCTPTAAPPRWLTLRHPECLRVDADGRAQLHGSRQHASHFSPVFRDYSRRITRALAEHFKDNPNIIGWQTDNEFHCHFSQDHCAAAQSAFTAFLRERYHDDIGALNRAWGTAFWAQTYRDFDEIETPRSLRPAQANPAHVLDYHRFLSHGATVFQRDQVKILRDANPRWWITHNGWFRSLDYRGEFRDDLDFLSYDSYPFFDCDPATRAQSHAYNLDYMRSFSGNFVVMEHQAGAGAQGDYMHDTPEPGELRRMAYASIAHGADGLLLFRERTCPFGAEQYWRGVLDHDNIPRCLYHEAAQLGGELKRIGPAILGTRVQIDIAVTGGDFTALHAHEPVTHGLPSPRQAAEDVHRYFHKRGHAVGCVHPEDIDAGVRLFVLTHYTTFDEAWLERLTAWVVAGGVLVVGARTATKDLNNNVVTESFPGVLRGLAGVTVDEYGRQNRPASRPLLLRFGDAADEKNIASTLWYEQLTPIDGAQVEVVATWESRHLAGTPAITRRKVGAGAVYYVGTYFDDALLDALAAAWRAKKELPTASGLPAGVERVIRQGKTHRLVFLINHTDAAVTLYDVPQGHDLIAGLPVSAPMKLQANGVAAIKCPPASHAS